VVLRVDSIRERLLKLEEAASGLERIAETRSSGSATDFRDDWAVERGLQVGAEAILDVGNHILSAHFGVSARDYEDIIVRLGSIDRARVAAYAARAPSDFRAFAGAIRAWLGTLPEP
jgi:hypothetical protein